MISTLVVIVGLAAIVFAQIALLSLLCRWVGFWRVAPVALVAHVLPNDVAWPQKTLIVFAVSLFVGAAETAWGRRTRRRRVRR